MAQITYTNKVALNENPEIANINKVTDDDMNEIKSVVNTNDDNVGNLANLPTTDKTSIVNSIIEINTNKASTNEVIISDTQPSASDNKLWINTGEIAQQVSEITNSYSTSTGLGYSANYVNNLHTYSETEQRIGTWIDGKPVYRRVIKSSFDTQTADDVRKNISTSGMDIKKIVEFNGFIDYTNQAPINSQNGYAAYFSTNNNIRVYNTISAYLNVDFYLIIYYTKTTD